MLKIALSPPVYDAILAYFRYHRDDEIALDELSAQQWETLKKIYVFLDDVAQTTKAQESNESSLDNVLTAMDYILYRFEAIKLHRRVAPCSPVKMFGLISLPYEVLSIIVTSIDFDDVFNLALTCTALKFLLTEERICKSIIQVRPFLTAAESDRSSILILT